MTKATEPARKRTRQSQHEGPRLLTHAQVLALADDSPSIIRVRDLQVTLKGPKDAWGRVGKVQPALLNVEVRMRNAFGESSETDEVKGDTVHYGLLAKEVLKVIEEEEGKDGLGECVAGLWRRLTGYLDMSCHMRALGSKPFLQRGMISYLKVSLTMTKASLLGEGVTVSWAAAFNEEAEEHAVNAGASSLSIDGLRVPVLVGVNANERTAKQIVLANLVVEEKVGLPDDLHPDLEAVVVQEMSDSHFETLEALAKSVMEKLKKRHAEQWKEQAAGMEWLFGLELRKPIAVPLAEAACVELRERTG